MAQKRLGVVVSAPDSSAVLTSIANLEQRGIPAAWLTSAGAGGADPLGALRRAALRTQHMLLGTAITQTFPRHPIAVVQQVQVLAQLAPGRFRLGLGTSGRAGMEQTYGVNFRAPWATCGNICASSRPCSTPGPWTLPDAIIRPTPVSRRRSTCP